MRTATICGALMALSIAAADAAERVTPATERLIECVKREASRSGTGYTSSDGGLSAVRIMKTCEAAWAAYADECVAALKAAGKREKEIGDHRKGCNLAGGAMAQAALIYLGK